MTMRGLFFFGLNRQGTKIAELLHGLKPILQDRINPVHPVNPVQDPFLSALGVLAVHTKKRPGLSTGLHHFGPHGLDLLVEEDPRNLLK